MEGDKGGGGWVRAGRGGCGRDNDNAPQDFFPPATPDINPIPNRNPNPNPNSHPKPRP